MPYLQEPAIYIALTRINLDAWKARFLPLYGRDEPGRVCFEVELDGVHALKELLQSMFSEGAMRAGLSWYRLALVTLEHRWNVALVLEEGVC